MGYIFTFTLYQPTPKSLVCHPYVSLLLFYFVATWSLCYVFMQVNIVFSLQAIQDKYSRLHAISGPGFKVQFENSTISLVIPEDGITLKNGWTITPLVPPVVSLHCCYYWL